MRSWIVRFWERVFAALAWVSPFRVLGKLLTPLRTAGGVEAWVSGHVLVALGSAVLVTAAPQGWLTKMLVAYGALRVFEIIVYQVNVLLFDQLRAHSRGQQYALEGYSRIILLLLMNYFEIILWFAAAYGVLLPQLGEVPRSLPVLLFESFSTFTGFGATQLMPRTTVALAVIWAESAVGLFMSIVVLARFLAILPTPRSRTPGEEHGA